MRIEYDKLGRPVSAIDVFAADLRSVERRETLVKPAEMDG
jgi:hypothetical protein